MALDACLPPAGVIADADGAASLGAVGIRAALEELGEVLDEGHRAASLSRTASTTRLVDEPTLSARSGEISPVSGSMR